MSQPRNVVFRDGFSTPVVCWHLALDMEARGITLSVGRQGRLLATPQAALTAEDCGALREHGGELARLVAYARRALPRRAGSDAALGTVEQRTEDAAV